MMLHSVISFYKFVKTNNPKKLRKSLLDLLLNEDVVGTFLIAKEGINATVSGSDISLKKIMKFLDKLNLSPFSEWHYSIIDKEYVFDISKAQKILGWNPKKSNNQLFQESYDWFVENSEKLKITGTTHTTKLNPKIFKLIDKL